MFKQNKKVVVKSLMVLLLSWILLPQGVFVGEVVAQTAPTDNQNTSAWKSESQLRRESIISMTNFMETFSKVSYLFLWPLIALAWLAMDNSLVYWSFMWLDVPLWKIWQVARTFANYTLWVMFLVWILMYNLSPTWKVWIKWVKTIWELIKNTLVASVLIQASWFLMMALVDLSTILTYSVWGLPTTVLTQINSWSDMKVLQENIKINLWDIKAEKLSDLSNQTDAIINYWSLTWSEAIAPCRTVALTQWNMSQTFILWRRFVELTWTDNKTLMHMRPGYCVYLWRLISYNDFYGWNSDDTKYQELLQQFITNMSNAKDDQIKTLIGWWIVIPATDWNFERLSWKIDEGASVTFEWTKEPYVWKVLWCKWSGWAEWEWDVVWEVIATKTWEDTEKDFICIYKEGTYIPTLSSIIEKAGSMTGPFSALYSNLSLFSSFDSVPSWLWLWQKFIVMAINIVFAVLLLLPLVALVLVLFARIWILWLLIALSPFFVILKVFSQTFDIKLSFSIKTSDLIRVLLAPVLISFAVSLSLVFMSTLKNAVWRYDAEAKLNLQNLTWITEEKWGYSILWFIKIKMDTALQDLSWILMMVFWLWVTWFLLFWAIKSCWEYWAKIGWRLEWFWKDTLKNMPLIPLPWWGALTYKSLVDAPTEISNSITRELTSKSDESLKKLLWTIPPEKKWKADTWDAWNDERITKFIAGNGSFMETFGYNTSSNPSQVMSMYESVISHEWWEWVKDKILKEINESYMSKYMNGKSWSDLEFDTETKHYKWNWSSLDVSDKAK